MEEKYLYEIIESLDQAGVLLDIPEIINSVENIIEKNENELEISWI